MTASEIVSQLQSLGNEGTARVLRNHGATDPVYGVKVEELKKFQKTLKKNDAVARELYATGIYDAMYLAGLVADETKLGPDDLRGWMDRAPNLPVAEFVVAWVAADGPHGWDLGLEWIESADPQTAAAGWAALSGWVSVRPDADLDLPALRALLHRVETTLADQPDPVRLKMNGFVICVGCYVADLLDAALATAERLGTVTANRGKTACKIPSAADYIRKVQGMGRTGKKRKTARC